MTPARNILSAPSTEAARIVAGKVPPIIASATFGAFAPTLAAVVQTSSAKSAIRDLSIKVLQEIADVRLAGVEGFDGAAAMARVEERCGQVVQRAFREDAVDGPSCIDQSVDGIEPRIGLVEWIAPGWPWLRPQSAL